MDQRSLEVPLLSLVLFMSGSLRNGQTLWKFLTRKDSLPEVLLATSSSLYGHLMAFVKVFLDCKLETPSLIGSLGIVRRSELFAISVRLYAIAAFCILPLTWWLIALALTHSLPSG